MGSCYLVATLGSFRLLRLRLEIGLAGRQVNWKRDVGVQDFPFALHLVEAIGHAENHIHRLALITGAGEMLDAAGEAQLAVGIHMQIDKLDLGILNILEEIVEVVVDRFGSGELARRREVVDRHLVARVITFRHQLIGAGCRGALMLKVRDLGFRVGGVCPCAEAPGEDSGSGKRSGQQTGFSHVGSPLCGARFAGFKFTRYRLISA